MLGFTTAGKGLDDDHAASAAGARTRQYGLLIRFIGFGRLGLLRRHGEQLTGMREIYGSVATSEQSVVSNAVEALGQDVEQEAADELICECGGSAAGYGDLAVA